MDEKLCAKSTLQLFRAKLILREGISIVKEIVALKNLAETQNGRLVQLGARPARYFGPVKVAFQVSLLATVANLTLAAS